MPASEGGVRGAGGIRRGRHVEINFQKYSCYFYLKGVLRAFQTCDTEGFRYGGVDKLGGKGLYYAIDCAEFQLKNEISLKSKSVNNIQNPINFYE